MRSKATEDDKSAQDFERVVAELQRQVAERERAVYSEKVIEEARCLGGGFGP